MTELFRDINVVPRHTYDFLWADYVELLCLCSRNGEISSGNLQAQAQEAQDIQIDSEEQTTAQEDSEVLDDRISQRWEDIRRKLQARSKSWAPSWPFRLEGSILVSQFRPEDANHRLYVALLIASSLRLCHPSRSNEVTSAFEEISYHWLRLSLNEHWEIRPFGAHQSLTGAYAGTLRAKLETLAKDIQATLTKPADAYEPQDTGDGGIDLVAWMKMGDRRGNLPVIFGQCACSPTDWESKQLSVSTASIEAHIHPHHPGAAYCFVPHDLHLSDTLWERESHVLRTVMVDRTRILRLFQTTESSQHLPNWDFVDAPAKRQQALAT